MLAAAVDGVSAKSDEISYERRRGAVYFHECSLSAVADDFELWFADVHPSEVSRV